MPESAPRISRELHLPNRSSGAGNIYGNLSVPDPDAPGWDYASTTTARSRFVFGITLGGTVYHLVSGFGEPASADEAFLLSLQPPRWVEPGDSRTGLPRPATTPDQIGLEKLQPLHSPPELPLLAIHDTIIAEGSNGTVNAPFPVTLSPPSSQIRHQ